MVERAD